VIGQDGSEVAIALANILKANLVPDFSAYVAPKPGRGGKAGSATKPKPIEKAARSDRAGSRKS
jgi:hypothetical protein